MEHYIGLISGTSADGIDAALAGFEDGHPPRLLESRHFPYPAALRRRVESAITSARATPADFAALGAALGRVFGDAACALRSGMAGGERPCAVGCHGQTVYHATGPGGRSIQLGDPNRIATLTGLPVVADFRNADIAAGGEGAPLAPLFHAEVFGGPAAVLNLGGIANLTLIDADGGVTGFDTGPANTLLDGWAARTGHGDMDVDGTLAVAGEPDAELLEALRADEYFRRQPPKSTGRERFNLDWLDARIAGRAVTAADVQATLVELTVTTIVDALGSAGVARVLCCGGGVHNPVLMRRLTGALAPLPVESTGEHGVDPDFVEAMTFAWLARERMHGRSPRHLQAVTGAREPAVLGGLWLPPDN